MPINVIGILVSIILMHTSSFSGEAREKLNQVMSTLIDGKTDQKKIYSLAFLVAAICKELEEKNPSVTLGSLQDYARELLEKIESGSVENRQLRRRFNKYWLVPPSLSHPPQAQVTSVEVITLENVREVIEAILK